MQSRVESVTVSIYLQQTTNTLHITVETLQIRPCCLLILIHLGLYRAAVAAEKKINLTTQISNHFPCTCVTGAGVSVLTVTHDGGR